MQSIKLARLLFVCVAVISLIFAALPYKNVSASSAESVSGSSKTDPNRSLEMDNLPKGNLTYAGDIAPILMNRCASCHQPGGIAPFSLTSYEDAKKRSSTIDAVVAAKVMPPWKPAPAYGEFLNARCMSEKEIASIREWIKQGAPPGDLSKAPSLPESQRQSAGEWRNGKPDLIVRMPQPYKVAADGADIYRCFVFPLNASDNKFVSQVEFHPGNPKVLHHALFFLDNTGTARKKDEEDPAPGFASFGGPGFMPTGSL
ncbi:MAG: cytochrome c, partial [Candidatus Obscuribacterales bacterium]|nr:cytochrome c [Candidatus Obscuribacterales bacterium]